MAAQSVGPAISTGSVAITGTSAADPLQSIITKDGLSVSLDDYVYMTPDDPTEPFFIGRVMAFLPPAKPGYPEQVRVGWFYRPRDVLGGRRKHYDLRLLLASMHSDVNSSSCIRGKCHVRHSHQIPDLVGYKSHEDHFYYNQLFDRYTHRLFDVVPIEIARNLPKPVLEALSGHDFIVVEAGRAADYTDARNCSICEGLCASDESIKCGGCESIFHLPCVYLSRKPTKGYVWECIDCQRKALQQSTGLATPNLRSSTPSSLMSSVSVQTPKSTIGCGFNNVFSAPGPKATLAIPILRRQGHSVGPSRSSR
ncbi:BAH domain-containing protein [Zopfochytrium polystomum]|nr:BAH domain-containing protein [Zopfochytrium polystomum]